MSFLTALLSPFNLLFFIIVVGLSIGSIRIRHISLGISGILFVAMAVGFLLNLLISSTNLEIITATQGTLKTLSSLGTSIFISAIGLQTGLSIKGKSKESVIAFTIGAAMSISGVAMMLLISFLDTEIGYPSLLGILCGALTSTPGLACVCELLKNEYSDAVLAYSGSYLFGVIFVVFFAHFFSRCTTGNKAEAPPNSKSKIIPELMLISLAALSGSIMSNLKIPILGSSLGSSAYTLTFGVILGYITNKALLPKLISPHCLSVFKNIGLALFFAQTGFSAGVEALTYTTKTAIYGTVITLTAIFCGWLSSKILSLNRPLLPTGFIIAGGMTSSPAYAAIDYTASESSTNCFSFAYFGALSFLIIALQTIAKP